MTEDLKGLIEKIQREGFKAAEEKARQIETKARDEAQAMIDKAKKEAQKLLREAQEEIIRTQESTHAALKQAGRDVILALRKEVESMLQKLLVRRVREAMNPVEMAKMIVGLLKETKAGHGINVTLKKEDLDKIEKSLLSELSDEIKAGLILRGSEDIQGGFMISFDQGKSQFDFTDKAIAEYIGTTLKPKLREIF